MKNTFERIRYVLQELLGPSDITPQSTMAELECDDIDAAREAVQDEFDIELPAGEIVTVADFVRLVDSCEQTTEPLFQ